jgi:Zn finger protein HypA/HybF involved in hydrogenase expression
MPLSYLKSMQLAVALQKNAELTNAKVSLSKDSVTFRPAIEKMRCPSCGEEIEPDTEIAVCNRCGGGQHILCSFGTKKCATCGTVLEMATESEKEAAIEVIKAKNKRKPLSDKAVTITQATEKARCAQCNGKIKKGFDIAVCKTCQSTEHKLCAELSMKCGKCGASFE